MSNPELKNFRRIVVKVGSSLLIDSSAGEVRASWLAALAADGGRLYIVDFGQQQGWPGWFKAMLFAWLAKFSVSPRAELEAELRHACDAAGWLKGG